MIRVLPYKKKKGKRGTVINTAWGVYQGINPFGKWLVVFPDKATAVNYKQTRYGKGD